MLDALRGETLGRDAGIKIVRRALEEPLRQIVANAGQEPPIVLQRVLAGTANFGYNAATEAMVTWWRWASSTHQGHTARAAECCIDRELDSDDRLRDRRVAQAGTCARRRNGGMSASGD